MARSEASGCQIAHASSAAVASVTSAATTRPADGRQLMGSVPAASWDQVGSRPATKPALTSAIAAGAGMNQVQSRSDWTANTIGTSVTATSAIRLSSQSRRGSGSSARASRTRRRGSRLVALRAAIAQARPSRVVMTNPMMPRSAAICGIQP